MVVRKRVMTVRDVPTCKECGKQYSLVLSSGCIVCTKDAGGCGAFFLIDEIATLYKRMNHASRRAVVRSRKKG